MRCMKHLTLLAALALGLAAVAADAPAQTQLVPLSQCGAAIPCSIPVGLRPADAAAASPYGRVGAGNTLVSMAAAVDESLKPRVVTRAVAEDPSERAARLFLRKNPSWGLRTPAPAPTPPPLRPEDLQLP